MTLLYIHIVPPSQQMANIIQVINMTQAFCDNGINVKLVLPATEIKKDIKKQYFQIIQEKLGVNPKFELDFYKTYNLFNKKLIYLNPILFIKSYLKLQQKDYCYVFTRSFMVNRIAIQLGFKVIFESHNSILSNKKYLNKLYSNILVNNTKNKNQILFITISNSLKRFWISKGIPENKILALHDGVTDELLQNPISQKEARKFLKIDENKKIAVYTGSLAKDRGIELIIELAKDFPEVLFYLVGGDPNQIEYYKNIVLHTKLRNIIFVGYIPHYDVKNYLFASDILIMIWTWKIQTMNYCSPLKVFEYMASGRIIVGHSFPTIKEILTDKRNALLADPDSYDELKNKFTNALIYHYPNHLSNNAVKDVRKYTWNERVKKIMTFINADDER